MQLHALITFGSFGLSTSFTSLPHRIYELKWPAVGVLASEVNSELDVLFLDEAEGEESVRAEVPDSKPKKLSRWDQLHPRVKARISKKGQERAVANKAKRVSAQTRKRQMMMFAKEKQRERKRESRVVRNLPFDERTPLSAYIPGMQVTGTVISVVRYGAYIDIGSECDGLLHISQLSPNGKFIEHPSQVLSPGDEIQVCVRSVNPEKTKLQLTLKTPKQLQEELQDDAADRISFDDIDVDDELWGEVKRVTDFGAFVEVGAIKDGFLHFMDHPLWQNGLMPADIMQSGQRIRVWAMDVDRSQSRLKLTAVRPRHLPGPRREPL